jgi:Fe-S cluster biosynthesis and repair protein YggX
MENFEYWVDKIETELTINNYKLKHNISDEEWDERVRKQTDIIKTERLTRNINTDLFD